MSIAEIKARLAAAPLLNQKLIGHHTRPIAEVKDAVISSLRESIDNSIRHDGGHAWHWIELEDGTKICETGCGPNSAVNMAFFGHAPTDIARLIRALELATHTLTRFSTNDTTGLPYVTYYERTLPDGTRVPPDCEVADEVLAAIDKMLGE